MGDITSLMIRFGIDASDISSGTAKVRAGIRGAEEQSASSMKGMSSHFDEAGRHVGGLHNMLSGMTMGLGMGVFNEITQGLHSVVGVVEDSAKAYEDAQASQAQLATALTNQSIPAADATSAAMQRNIDQFTAWGFSADAMRNNLSLLVGATHDLGTAQSDEALAANIARLRHVDLDTATQAVIKAQEGQYRGLKAIGVEVPKGSTAAQALALAWKVAGGQADTFAKGPAGLLAAAHQKVHETMVKVGKITDQVSQAVMPALADAFSAIVDAAGPVLDQLGTVLPPALDAVKGGIKAIVDGASPFIKTFATEIPKALSPLMDAFKDITSDGDKMKGVLAIIGALVLAVVVPPFLLWAAATLAATWPIFAVGLAVGALILILDKTGMLKELGKNIIPALGAAFTWLQTNVLPPLMDLFNYITTQVLPPLIDTISSIYKAILPALKVAFDVIGAVLPPIMDAVAKGIQIAVKLIETQFDLIKAGIGLVVTVFQGVQTAVGVVWDAITAVIKTQVNGIIGIINFFIGAIDAVKFHVHFDIPNPLGGNLASVDFGYPGLNIGRLSTLALGTANWRGGPAIVGDRGPELVDLPSGSRVTPAAETARMRGGHTFNFNITNPKPEPASSSIQMGLLMAVATGHVGMAGA